MLEQLEQQGLVPRIGEDHRSPTIGVAVKAHVWRTGHTLGYPVPE
jgi:hypothetical protein